MSVWPCALSLGSGKVFLLSLLLLQFCFCVHTLIAAPLFFVAFNFHRRRLQITAAAAATAIKNPKLLCAHSVKKAYFVIGAHEAVGVANSVHTTLYVRIMSFLTILLLHLSRGRLLRLLFVMMMMFVSFYRHTTCPFFSHLAACRFSKIIKVCLILKLKCTQCSSIHTHTHTNSWDFFGENKGLKNPAIGTLVIGQSGCCVEYTRSLREATTEKAVEK